MNIKKLSVYDVNAWLIREKSLDDKGNQLQVHKVSGEFAIIKGPEKTLIMDREGCGEIVENNGMVEIQLSSSVNGGVSIFPTMGIKVSVDEIEEHCPKAEPVYIVDFIRRFGGRLENNFRAMLNALNEIDVHPGMYHVGFTR